jgi:hypothetical protein
MNYQSVEILQEHGIAANDIEKLKNAGYHTVESVRIKMTKDSPFQKVTLMASS